MSNWLKGEELNPKEQLDTVLWGTTHDQYYMMANITWQGQETIQSGLRNVYNERMFRHYLRDTMTWFP